MNKEKDGLSIGQLVTLIINENKKADADDEVCVNNLNEQDYGKKITGKERTYEFDKEV